MSWYDEDWDFRLPISVYQAASGGTSDDVTFVVPTHIDHFWENVAAAGADVRITDADGRTLETFDLDAFDKSTRAGTFEIDNATLTEDAVNLFWLYYGNSAATTAVTSFAPSGPTSGDVAVELPAGIVVAAVSERPGATKPTTEIAKTPDEEVNVYIELTGSLVGRARTSEGDNRFEEPSWLYGAVYRAGTLQVYATHSIDVEQSKCRFIEHKGRLFARIRVRGGADDTDYTLSAMVQTTGLDGQTFSNPRIIEPRALIKVREVSEA